MGTVIPPPSTDFVGAYGRECHPGFLVASSAFVGPLGAKRENRGSFNCSHLPNPHFNSKDNLFIS